MGKQVPLIQTLARYPIAHTHSKKGAGIELHCHPGRGGWGVVDRKNFFFSVIYLAALHLHFAVSKDASAFICNHCT